MRLLFVPYLFLVLILFSCTPQKGSPESQEIIVAKVGEDELRRDEVSEIMISVSSAKDSSMLLKRSIDSWATDMLFYREALSKLNQDEIDIEKQVEAYRRSLVNHIYQTKIIEANLDTNVSRDEIEEYYADNRDNFILKDNIVKVNYFKIPLKVQVLEKMKKLFYATQPKDKEQLINLCVQYAENYFINDSTWLYLDDIKKEIPNLKDQAELVVSSGKVFEFTDELYYYFLRIKDMKVKNSLSPINFERQNIKTLIINRRKTDLIREYRKQMLQKAREEKRFVVY